MASYFGFDACSTDSGLPYVFISYKNEDCERVAVYAKYLHDNGINVWYDNGLHAGTDWESHLMDVIENPNCKAVLLFVSANVAESTVIPLETTQARICKKPTVAVYLEGGLDLESILSKAIKIYVEQRQSVNAYIGSQESVCKEILEAAAKAMEGKAASPLKASDELWNNAQVFLNNFMRSRSIEDVKSARGFLDAMTKQSPADYRGWMGLAICECMPKVVSLDDARERLNNASKYYSYVVSLGADGAASANYTREKSRMWRELLEFIRAEFKKAEDTENAVILQDKAEFFAERLGHTEKNIQEEYLLLINDIRKAVKEMQTQDHIAFRNSRVKRRKRRRRARNALLIIALILIIAAFAAYKIMQVLNG